MKAHPIRSLLALLALLSGLGCEGPDEAPNGPAPSTAYDVAFRTDAQLTSELEALCRTSRATARPLLVEFSAAWCSDCRRLHAMKQAPALAEELDAWPRIVVNVGRFDRHRRLLAELGVESIAHWEVLAPIRCNAPIGDWPSLARRTLEVSSGEARSLTPDDLARWLAAIRASGAG